MKARVKETGKIIELSTVEFDVYGNGYLRTGLEFIDEPDYWDKLRHQYAGMFLQGMIIGKPFTRDYVEDAYQYATALINRLKEESQCEK